MLAVLKSNLAGPIFSLRERIPLLCAELKRNYEASRGGDSGSRRGNAGSPTTEGWHSRCNTGAPSTRSARPVGHYRYIPQRCARFVCVFET